MATTNRKSLGRWIYLILGVMLLLLLLAVGGFVVWATWIPSPMPEALAALQGDAQVTVTTTPWLTFQPVTSTVRTGLILYPGARVDVRAYAPAAHQIAAHGYWVVLPAMPLNLAVLAPERAEEIIAHYPTIQRWALGGHSLGGAMAATYVYNNYVDNHPGKVKALILWAAYPATSNTLAQRTDLIVTSIYGTRDGLATPEKIVASHALLPATTQWVAIDGGNHAQFGWYGAQAGDNVAMISRADQQAQIVQATLATLAKLAR